MAHVGSINPNWPHVCIQGLNNHAHVLMVTRSNSSSSGFASTHCFSALRSFWWVRPSSEKTTSCAPATWPPSRSTRVPRSPAKTTASATPSWTPTSVSASVGSPEDTARAVSSPVFLRFDVWIEKFHVYALPKKRRSCFGLTKCLPLVGLTLKRYMAVVFYFIFLASL